ncbi:MAG: regulatory protein RecX [Mangrovibacterium sp.]
MAESNERISFIFSRAAALCSRAEKSPLSIHKKTIQWGLTSDEAETVLQKLFEHNFLNEQRFASSYVRDKYRFNRWGRIKIVHHLKNEGISANCIALALQEIDIDAYEQNLLDLLTEKYKKTKAKDAYRLRLKVIRYAQSRGFESNMIFDTYNTLISDN